MSTSIEWVRGEDGGEGSTWNFARGCSLEDAACQNCYAMKQAHRFSGKGQPYDGLTVLGKHGPRWVGNVRFIPEALAIPLKWRKGRRIFPCSMSDAFHESLTNEQIAAAFGVMAATPRHTYVMTTKRAKRMREWFEWASEQRGGARQTVLMCALDMERETHPDADGGPLHTKHCADPVGPWPLPNVHLGVSAGTQASADDRIADLLKTPAAVRWVSLEPLLESVSIWAFLKSPKHELCLINLGGVVLPGLDWVVVGAESGAGSRCLDLAWVRDVLAQCNAANVPCFVKQLGERPYEAKPANGGPHGTDEALARIGSILHHPQRKWFKDWCLTHTPDGQSQWVKHYRMNDRKGGDMSEWPSDIRIRQFPG